MGKGTDITEVKKDRIFLWEKIFAFTGLFLSTNAIIPLYRKVNGIVFDPFHGDILLQVLWAGIYIITVILLAKRWPRIFHLVFKDKLVWLLVILALISVLWSEAPLVTLRRSVALLGTTAFGVYLATRYTRQELLELLVWTLGLSAILSFGLVLFFPLYGIHPKYYLSLRGVYENRNILGCFMTLAAITWLIYSFSRLRVNIIGLVFWIISIALLFLSKSITALLVFTLLMFLLLFFQVARYQNKLFHFLFITILVTGILVVWLGNNTSMVLNILGRDATLSGRTGLWQAVWEMVQQRPWLGYGYSSFWLGWEGPSRYLNSSDLIKLPHAHNGYLDLWLQLGLAGLFLFAISFFVNMVKSYILLCKKDGIEEMYHFIFLLFVMFYNIPESFILAQNSMFWILYVTASIQLNIEFEKLKRGG